MGHNPKSIESRASMGGFHVEVGPSNSSIQPSQSSHVPSVAFPRLTEVTARSADSLFAVPALSTGAEWDGTLETVTKQAAKYVGPDTKINPWLRQVFGPDPMGTTTKSLRTAVRLVDGQIQYHDVLALASEWDEIGPAQPQEFVDALRFEVDGTRQAIAVNSIMVGLTTGRAE